MGAHSPGPVPPAAGRHAPPRGESSPGGRGAGMRPCVAMILPDLRGGGAERVALDLADEFAARGIGVRFVLMQAEGAFLAEAAARHRIVDLGAGRMRSLLRPLVRHLRADPPDALLAHLWPVTGIAALAARLARMPGRVAVVEHGVLSRAVAPRGALHRLGLGLGVIGAHRLADARIAVSEGVAADLRAIGRGFAPTIEVIPNPVRAPSRSGPLAAPAAAALCCVEGTARILSVGSFKPVKNHALLIRAFARLARRRPAVLTLLGEGALRADLAALARAEGVADRVRMPGFAADPWPFYRSADLFALSSDSEGFANVLVEALAVGLPVVATDCGAGPRAVLGNGRHGRIVPPGDAAALAQAMEAALVAPGPVAPRIAHARSFAPARAATRYLHLLFPAGPDG